MINVFGLMNCDNCRQAVKDLKAASIAYNFHDFRRDGLDSDKLKTWFTFMDYEAFLNKRGTTWRGLSEKDKENLNSKTVIALMIQFPAIIKRPVFEIEDKILVGYKELQKKVLGL